jgi:hypothetical protein
MAGAGDRRHRPDPFDRSRRRHFRGHAGRIHQQRRWNAFTERKNITQGLAERFAFIWDDAAGGAVLRP